MKLKKQGRRSHKPPDFRETDALLRMFVFARVKYMLLAGCVPDYTIKTGFGTV